MKERKKEKESKQKKNSQSACPRGKYKKLQVNWIKVLAFILSYLMLVK